MKEGLIPTILGAGVTVSGVFMECMKMKNKNLKRFMPIFAAGVIGFGLAHVLLGSIELCEERE